MEGIYPDLIKRLRVIYYRRKRFVYIPFIVFAPMIVTIAIFLPETYRSSTTILVEPQKISKDYVKPTVTTSVTDRLRTIIQQIMSPNRLRKVLVNLNLVQDMSDRNLLNRLIGTMQKNINIDVSGKESFKITFTGKNPTMVMNITNQIASLFIEENLRLSELQAQSTTEFLSSELANVERQLQEQEEKQRIFKQKYMGELPDQLDTNLRTLDRLQMQLQTTRGLLKDNQDQIIVLEQQIAIEKKEISNAIPPDIPIPPDPLFAKLKVLKARFFATKTRYSDDWPEIKRLKSEIVKVEMQIEKRPKKEIEKKIATPAPSLVLNTLKINIKLVERRVVYLNREGKLLMSEIEEYKKRVENAPKREVELISLGRDYKILRNTYQSLLDKKLEAKLSESLEKKQKGENFIVLDSAEFPLSPYFPQLYQIILAGLGGGLGLSFLFVYLSEFMDQSFNDLDEVDRCLGFAVIGAIPRIRTRSGQRRMLLQCALITIVLLVYVGTLGLIVFNKEHVKKRLSDWEIIPMVQLI